MNKQEAIKAINSIKSSCELKGKKYSESNLLKLNEAINNANLDEDKYELLMKFYNEAQNNNSLSTSLVDAIYNDDSKDNIVDKLFKQNRIVLEEIRWARIDNKNIELSEEQLDEVYERATQEDMAFKSKCIMNNASYYEEQLVEDKISMYIDEGEDEDEAEDLAIEEASDIESEANSYVEYLLSDKKSEYDSRFKVEEITDEENIVFTIEDRLKKLLDGEKFSENDEPVIHDEDINLKVTLFKTA